MRRLREPGDPARGRNVDVIRAARRRRPTRPAPRPAARPATGLERFAPLVIGDDGVILPHPDYEQ